MLTVKRCCNRVLCGLLIDMVWGLRNGNCSHDNRWEAMPISMSSACALYHSACHVFMQGMHEDITDYFVLGVARARGRLGR